MAGFTDLDQLPSWYVDLMIEDAMLLSSSIWLATLRGLTTSKPPTDEGLIDVPTLVVSGEQDGILGREQAGALVAAIAGARWLEYPSTGHLVLEEQPGRLAADIVAFLAGLPPTRRA